MAILFFHHSFSYQKIYETTDGGRVWLAGESTPWIYTNSYGTLKNNLKICQSAGLSVLTGGPLAVTGSGLSSIICFPTPCLLLKSCRPWLIRPSSPSHRPR